MAAWRSIVVLVVGGLATEVEGLDVLGFCDGLSGGRIGKVYDTQGAIVHPRERSVATMLPRPGSTRGDSRRLEGTTAWLEREDRQRLSARSPLPSST